MATKAMIDLNDWYIEHDDWIRSERKKLLLTIGEVRHAANVIYSRERNGGNLKHWETVARNIISDAARHPYFILDVELDAMRYIINWYCLRTNHIEKDWIELIDFLSS